MEHVVQWLIQSILQPSVSFFLFSHLFWFNFLYILHFLAFRPQLTFWQILKKKKRFKPSVVLVSSVICFPSHTNKWTLFFFNLFSCLIHLKNVCSVSLCPLKIAMQSLLWIFFSCWRENLIYLLSFFRILIVWKVLFIFHLSCNVFLLFLLPTKRCMSLYVFGFLC